MFHDPRLLLLLYFAILVGLSMLKTVPLPGRTLHLLRAFLPSWKFFEDLGEVATLHCRFALGDRKLGAWRPVLEKPPRRFWRSLLVNPQGNFLLAANSLTQQLLGDLHDLDDDKIGEFENSVSFQLTKNLVRSQIARAVPEAEISLFQFKVSTRLPDPVGASEQDVLISPVYEV